MDTDKDKDKKVSVLDASGKVAGYIEGLLLYGREIEKKEEYIYALPTRPRKEHTEVADVSNDDDITLILASTLVIHQSREMSIEDIKAKIELLSLLMWAIVRERYNLSGHGGDSLQLVRDSERVIVTSITKSARKGGGSSFQDIMREIGLFDDEDS